MPDVKNPFSYEMPGARKLLTSDDPLKKSAEANTLAPDEGVDQLLPPEQSPGSSKANPKGGGV